MILEIKKWMWELDHKASWAWKNWCFWTVVLEKTLESPLDCKESILKEISPEYLLEGLILKLKLQYIGHLMWRTDSVEKTFMLGKIEGRRGRDEREWDGWMASLTWWTWVWVNSGSWWWTGNPGMLQSMGSQKSQTWLSDWIELNNIFEKREGKGIIHNSACETGTTQILKSDKDITRKKNCRPRLRSLSFPGGPVAKNPPASAGDSGDTGSIPGSGRAAEEGNGNPLQYSCLENPTVRGAWRATAHGVGCKESDMTEAT